MYYLYCDEECEMLGGDVALQHFKLESFKPIEKKWKVKIMHGKFRFVLVLFNVSTKNSTR